MKYPATLLFGFLALLVAGLTLGGVPPGGGPPYEPGHWPTQMPMGAGTGWATSEDLPQPIVTRQTLFAIPFHLVPAQESSQQAVEVQLYVSTDRGRQWQLYQRVRPTDGQFLVRTTGEGEYWFLVRTVDRAGRVRPQGPPRPEMRVLVDLTPPVLALAVEPSSSGSSAPVIIRWKMTDRSLRPETLRITYRTAPDGPWQPFPMEAAQLQAIPEGQEGQMPWNPPAGALRVELRAEVTDAAGNWAVAHAQVQNPLPPTMASLNPPGNLLQDQWRATRREVPGHPLLSDSPSGGLPVQGSLPGQGRESPTWSGPGALGENKPIGGILPSSAQGAPGGLPAGGGAEAPYSQANARPLNSPLYPPVQHQFSSPGADQQGTNPEQSPRLRTNHPSGMGGPEAIPPNRVTKSSSNEGATPSGSPPPSANSPSSGAANSPPSGEKSLSEGSSPSGSGAKSASGSTPPSGSTSGSERTPPSGTSSLSGKTPPSSRSSDSGTAGLAQAGSGAPPGNASAGASQSKPAAPSGQPNSPPPKAGSQAGESPEASAKPAATAVKPAPVSPAAPLKPGASPLQASENPIASGPSEGTIRMVNARIFELEYEVAGTTPPGRVELWATRDGGRTWQCWGPDTDGRSPMIVSVPEEGIYGFRVLVSSDPRSPTSGPQPGEMPDVWIGVDWTRPTGRILAVEPIQTDQEAQLLVRWEAADRYLAQRPISLFYSPTGAGGSWTPIATELENTGQYLWKVPAHVPDRIYIRLEIRDQAGNLTVDHTREAIRIGSGVERARIRDVRPVSPGAKALLPGRLS